MKRTYSEIMDDVQKARYGKECRKLHKELKGYYHDGLPLFMRYPNAPKIFLIIVSILLFVPLAALILLEFATVLMLAIQMLTG